MRISNLKESLFVALCLIQRDLVSFRNFFLNNIIDAAIWVSLTLLMFRYTFMKAGMNGADFALFMVCGNVVSWGLLEIMGPLTHFVADITGKRSIEYTLTLPIGHSMAFIAIGFSFAVKSMLSSLCVLPIAKIIFWHELSFSNILWGKFLTIFILQNFFFGFFTLYLASLLHDIRAIRHIFRRLVFPLWWLGGYTFSWQQAYALSPYFGYAALCNPLLYALEGVRGAVLGQEGYISFWYCVIVLCIAVCLCAFLAVRKLLVRLDCVW